MKVNRRGARVLYHQGYYAREEFTVFDRRDVISQSRVAAALRYPRPVDDLRMTVTATAGRSADGRHQMTVKIHVDPANLHVTNTGVDRFVSLDVAVFRVRGGLRTGLMLPPHLANASFYRLSPRVWSCPRRLDGFSAPRRRNRDRTCRRLMPACLSRS